MQEKKGATRPVRIKCDLLDRIEQKEIEISAQQGKLISIPELVHKLLVKALNDLDEETDK